MNSIKITEQINSNSLNINTKSINEILKIFNKEDSKIIIAVNKVLPNIEDVINVVISCFKKNGKLFYIGSGTSGRLGVLDAAECPPTFGTNPDIVQAIISGGDKAVLRSIEGVEDNIEQGRKIIIKKNISKNDIVLGISASGTAPYVLAALEQSKKNGAKTALISANLLNKKKYIDYYINVLVGPEIIAGSTRMKSGTATKMILNMISTISMLKMNKTHGNIMSDLKVNNKKLFNRGIRIISEISSVNKILAKEYLIKANGNIKIASIMIQCQCSFKKAKTILLKNNNSLSGIIKTKK